MARKPDFDKSHDPNDDGTCAACGCDLSGSLGKAPCAAAKDDPAE